MIEISRSDLYALLVCSLRYAMGRQSYVTGQVAGIVREFFGRLTNNECEIIIRDVEAEIENAIRLGTRLGAAIDHNEWTTLLEWMKDRLAMKLAVSR